MFGFIGAIASKLLGNKKPKQTIQTTRQEIDYVKMRRNAEAAGLNFLTAVRSGGAGGFTQTHTPVLSGGGRNVFGHIYDAASETAQNIMGAVGMGGGFGGVGANRSMMSGMVVQAPYDYNPVPQQTFRPASAAGQRRSLSVGPKPKPGPTTVTNPFPGDDLQVNPHFKDAEMAETRYGDIVQEIFGVMNLAADTYHNMVGYYNSGPRLSKHRASVAHGLSNYGVGGFRSRKPKYIHKSKHGRIHGSGLVMGW